MLLKICREKKKPANYQISAFLQRDDKISSCFKKSCDGGRPRP